MARSTRHIEPLLPAGGTTLQGSATLDLAFGVSSTATRTTRSSATLPLTLAIVSNATATVRASSTFPIVLSVDSQARLRVMASSTFPLVIDFSTTAVQPVFALLDVIYTGYIARSLSGSIENAENGRLTDTVAGVIEEDATE